MICNFSRKRKGILRSWGNIEAVGTWREKSNYFLKSRFSMISLLADVLLNLVDDPQRWSLLIIPMTLLCVCAAEEGIERLGLNASLCWLKLLIAVDNLWWSYLSTLMLLSMRQCGMVSRNWVDLALILSMKCISNSSRFGFGSIRFRPFQPNNMGANIVCFIVIFHVYNCAWYIVDHKTLNAMKVPYHCG